MQIVYVNINNSNFVQDGTSWETAFRSLQSALDVASALTKSEIKIAQGTYLPSKIYSPNGVQGGASGVASFELKTFDIPTGVKLTGGYKVFRNKNCKKTQVQCNPGHHKTILSAANTFWHVVTLGNDIAQTGVNVILEGLVISGGYAKGGSNAPDTITTPFVYAHSNGGGIYCTHNSSLVISKCVIENNKSNSIGGGIFSINSDFVLEKSIDRNNYANQQAGGLAVYNTYEGNTSHKSLISETIFERNSSFLFGGAVVIEGTLPGPSTECKIVDSRFYKNDAYEGGAVVVDSQTTLLKDCEFISNTAYVNGGAFTTTNVVNTIASGIQTPPVPLVKLLTTIDNCTFKRNQCMGDLALHDTMFGGPSFGLNFPLGGGAIVNYMNGLLNVYNSCFEENVSYNSDGGAILNGASAGQNIFSNSGFRSYKNDLEVSGISAYQVTTNINNCEFKDNRADGNGGAIASEPNSYVFTPPLVITVADTVLNVSDSNFNYNACLLKGGAIYLNRTTSRLENNTFKCNQSRTGNNNIDATDSNVIII